MFACEGIGVKEIPRILSGITVAMVRFDRPPLHICLWLVDKGYRAAMTVDLQTSNHRVKLMCCAFQLFFPPALCAAFFKLP